MRRALLFVDIIAQPCQNNPVAPNPIDEINKPLAQIKHLDKMLVFKRSINFLLHFFRRQLNRLELHGVVMNGFRQQRQHHIK